MYWAEALAGQDTDPELKATFAPVAESLAGNEQKIIDELNAAQGAPQSYGGYYKPDDEQAETAMRPSATLNGIIDGLTRAP
jgi:isocitrate dehydrogenase